MRVESSFRFGTDRSQGGGRCTLLRKASGAEQSPSARPPGAASDPCRSGSLDAGSGVRGVKTLNRRVDPLGQTHGTRVAESARVDIFSTPAYNLSPHPRVRAVTCGN